ncbi:MAG TPA: alpha/beta hydrolase [Candidatus Corynebacterium gallistercoris]|uniref:Alpha/beta hydrolase n=1 Tax=Candidatus Corynebacterium gallistercoris TaxID=2838530 RepID=A0A9D1RWC3_9CORY|nr:alpha/beta hydrolase [Candidatus Corynebacterium gallistercoris]
MKSIHVQIDTPSGETLAATVDMPGAGPDGAPVALVAHCFTCNRQSPGVSRISKTLARHGYVSVRVDFTGLGQSCGDFAATGLDSNVGDVIAAATWATDNFGDVSLLVGHSLGGSAVLAAASRIGGVKAVATVGAPFDPRHAAAGIPAAVKELSADEQAEAQLPGRPIKIGARLLRSLAEFSVEEALAGLADKGVPLLVLHSPEDRTVPFADAVKLFEAAAQPASLMAVPEVDHLLVWRGSGQRIGELVAKWAEPLVRVS